MLVTTEEAFKPDLRPMNKIDPPNIVETENSRQEIAINTGLKRFDYRSLLGRAGPLVLYGLVAIAFTWPLVLHLGDRVIQKGNSGDVWQHLWNIWWLRFSLLDLHALPYYTPMLYYPSGANLFFHALDPMDGYLFTPVQLITGVVAAFNLNILFQITVAGWGAYLLARYLTGNRAAALVAGLIYACSPLESALVNLGQLELTSIEWLPLFILCLIKALNREKRPWLWRVLSVGLLIVLSLDSWYYVLYALIFSGLYGLYRLSQERGEWKRISLTLAGILTAYFVIISPLLFVTLREASSKGTTQGLSTVIYNSATLKGFFTTGPSLLWGLFGSKANTEFRGNFLGYVALILAGMGLITNFKKGWFWLATGLIYAGLALGPVLHLSFDPDWTSLTADNGLSMPDRLLYNLPFGNIARVPLRFTLITMLAGAMLAAFGLDWLVKKRLARWGWGWWAGPLLAGILVFLEFMPGARALDDTRVPAFYSQLQTEGTWKDFAILETPDRWDLSIIEPAMYYQSVHHHPIQNGYLSRKPEYSFKGFPGIRELVNLEQFFEPNDIIDPANLRNTAGVLQYYKIRYVIFHPSLMTPAQLRRADEVLKLVYGDSGQPFFQDADLQAWKTPDFGDLSSPPDPDRVLFGFNSQWGPLTTGPTGLERSIERSGLLNIFNPYSRPLKTTLQFASVRADKSGQLSLLLNDATQGKTGLTTNPAAWKINLTLQPGLNQLALQTGGTAMIGSIKIGN